MRQWIWNRFFKDKSPAWTAIFTGILTVFTYMVYRVTDRTDETARATQRAFLNFAGIGRGVAVVSDDPKTKSHQEILLNWHNSGTTPARNAIANVSGQPWPSELPQGFAFQDLNPAARQPIAVGPKEISGVRVIVPIEDLRSSWEGKSRLFFWGWVVYDDIFPDDPSRLTEFCAEMIQIGIPRDKDIADRTVPIVWNFTRCKEHNCYDQDCADYSARVKEARGK